MYYKETAPLQQREQQTVGQEIKRQHEELDAFCIALTIYMINAQEKMRQFFFS